MYIGDRQLGLIDPMTAGLFLEATVNWWDRQKIKKLVPEFPGLFERAVVDFGKFKAGVKYDLFDRQQRYEIMTWYLELPRLWETIRPNFLKDEAGREFGDRVDDFIGRLRRDDLYRNVGLGLAPVIVAGIFLVGGAAAGLWAVAYMKRQANISKMIDQVTAGALPPEVLIEAVKAEQTGGLFAGLSQFGGSLAFVAAAWVVYQITKKK